MKSKLTTMTIILVLIASTIYAQNIPQKISFQGRLIDANTQKPVTAEKNFTFKIGDWVEEHKNVQVSNGLYSVILGSINPIPLTLFDDWQANMKILVEGKEMAPDIEMVSVPYALKAGQLDGVYVRNGNVGISTQEPNSYLHVQSSDINNTNLVKIDFTGGNVGNNDSSSALLRILSNSSYRPLMSLNDKCTFYSNGNVQIYGNESPRVLEITGKRSMDSNGTFPGIVALSWHNDNNAVSDIYFGKLGRVTFGGNHTDNSYSNILYVASIEGVAEGPFSNSETMPTGIAFFTGKKGEKPDVLNKNIGTEKMRITNTGNIGIGTKTPNYKLQVNGDIACNALHETSDIRYKKNITPIQTPLQKVSQLKGINYEWKTEDYPEKNFSNGKQIGMIAQDVEKVIPEIVHTDNEGMKSISYDKITAVLVEAMKELNQKNEKAIQELKAENAQLKQIICEDRPNHEFCQN